MTMHGKRLSRMSGIWAAVVTLFLLSLAVVPPILLRGWLNRVPYLWQVFFPLLTLLSAFLVVRAVRRREGWVAVATWSLLCASAVCAATYHLCGGPRVCYALGRDFAIAFIVAQAVQMLADGFAGNDDAG